VRTPVHHAYIIVRRPGIGDPIRVTPLKNWRTHLVFRSPVAVLGRNRDRTEAINGDAEDRIDGTKADSVIDRQPQITQHFTERPVLARE